MFRKFTGLSRNAFKELGGMYHSRRNSTCRLSAAKNSVAKEPLPSRLRYGVISLVES
jgi:hypothetical protein